MTPSQAAPSVIARPGTVAIIGAGTAGLAAAIALAQRGFGVEVFEKHRSLAPLGAGLLIQPGGLQALAQLGALEDFESVSVPIERLQGRSHRGWLLVDIPYHTARPARAVTRPAMTGVLLRRATALGIRLRMGAEVTSVQPDGDSVIVATADEARLYAGGIIASGSATALAAGAGLSAPPTLYRWGALNAVITVPDWPWPNLLLQRFEGPRRLFGLMPSGRDPGGWLISTFWSLPLADLPGWRERGLAAWQAEMLTLWPDSAPVVERIERLDQFSFATYHHAWPRRLASGRLCLIGDAAHAMSPQLGLGSTLAMGDALALSQTMSQGNLESAFAAYAALRARRVKLFQLMSRAMTPCFQSSLPAWWRDTAFATSLWVPGMRALMRASVGG